MVNKKRLVIVLFLASFVVFTPRPGWTGDNEIVSYMTAAGKYFNLDSRLLIAIAYTESKLRSDAIGHNKNGSRDIGIMQINTWWLPTLAKYGITEEDLFDPLTNIYVGAWILAQNTHRFGPIWKAVGAYNSSKSHFQKKYIHKVMANYHRFIARD